MSCTRSDPVTTHVEVADDATPARMSRRTYSTQSACQSMQAAQSNRMVNLSPNFRRSVQVRCAGGLGGEREGTCRAPGSSRTGTASPRPASPKVVGAVMAVGGAGAGSGHLFLDAMPPRPSHRVREVPGCRGVQDEDPPRGAFRGAPCLSRRGSLSRWREPEELRDRRQLNCRKRATRACWPN